MRRILALLVLLVPALPAHAGPAEDALAGARCEKPVPALDGSIRKTRPSEAQVRAGFQSNGERIRRDSAINAYFAWLGAGQDHEAAAAGYHKGVKGYAKDFACWK